MALAVGPVLQSADGAPHCKFALNALTSMNFWVVSASHAPSTAKSADSESVNSASKSTTLTTNKSVSDALYPAPRHARSIR
jgi:hypothetical protein